MSESMREVLAREAAEAKAVSDAEANGEQQPAPGQRARKPGPGSAVYSLRLPIDSIDQLRKVAERLGEAPTALLRRWVLERLATETGPLAADHVRPNPDLTFAPPDGGVMVLDAEAHKALTHAHREAVEAFGHMQKLTQWFMDVEGARAC